MMKELKNRGYDPKTVLEYKSKIKSSGKNYLADETDANSDEYAHFYFTGTYEGSEVIYDCVLYTLRLQHESEMFERAEEKAAEHFPQYQKIRETSDHGDHQIPDDLEEEIGLYMAEVMVEIEEEGEVKVMEHVDLDLSHEFGIGVDAGLNIEKVTPEIIQRFIADFNADNLKLDESLYSFQMNNDDFET